MKSGPTIIMKCPHCGQHAKKQRLLSGNTFGASLWSDCKQISSMLPEYPKLVVCRKCKHFYWVKDAEEVDEIWNKNKMSYEKKNKNWSASFISFPAYDEYIRALDSDVIRNRSEEKYVRIQLWWLFNDHFRGKYSLINLFRNKMSEFNTVNIEKLLDLLDQENTTELIMKAELLRNLKRFDQSRELIESITDEKYAWIKALFLKNLEMKNPELFRLR